jgi:cytochrome c-type biogenesis protein CcmE
MRIRYSFIIIGALIIVSVVLAYDAFTAYINPYLSVSDIVEHSAEYADEEIQVLGVVVNGSRSWEEDGFPTFNLTDGQYTVVVIHEGQLPQGFTEGQQVVVIGNLASPDRIRSKEMLVKCPSKYEGEETSLLSDPVFLIALVIGSVALIYYVSFVLLKKH